MTEPDLFRLIVQSGADLTISKPTNYDLLRELAGIAKQTGARLTLTLSTPISHDVIRELCLLAGENLAFVDQP
jgi:hypothetical protein